MRPRVCQNLPKRRRMCECFRITDLWWKLGYVRVDNKRLSDLTAVAGLEFRSHSDSCLLTPVFFLPTGQFERALKNTQSYCRQPFRPISIIGVLFGFQFLGRHRNQFKCGSCQGIPMNLDTLLRTMVAKGASDLHLKVNCFPHLRINGELVPLGDQGKLGKEDSLMMAFSIMNSKPDSFTISDRPGKNLRRA